MRRPVPRLAEARGRYRRAKTSACLSSIRRQRLLAPPSAPHAWRLREFSANPRKDSPGKAGIKCTATGSNKKVGLRPPIRATRFRAKGEYIPAPRQKQGMAESLRVK